MSNNRLCACGCGERARPGRTFQTSHSFETARLWRGKGKGDTRKGMKHGVTIVYKDDAGASAPDPFESKELSVWNPQPTEWFRAEVVKCHAGNSTFVRLSNHELVFVHRTVMDYPLSHLPGLTVSVRIEPSDKGVKYRALEVAAPFDPDTEDVVVVNKWNGHFGVVIRACGCHLLVSSYEQVDLQPGETIYMSGFQSDGNPAHRTVATQIRKAGEPNV